MQILPAVVNFKPDMIFVSAGFDAHKKVGEPLRSRACTCAHAHHNRVGHAAPNPGTAALNKQCVHDAAGPHVVCSCLAWRLCCAHANGSRSAMYCPCVPQEDINMRYVGVTEADYEWLTDQIVQVANR